LEIRSLLAKKWKELIFRRKIPVDQEVFSRVERRPDAEEISVLIKEIRAKLH
jgi:hypothetical protein